MKKKNKQRKNKTSKTIARKGIALKAGGIVVAIILVVSVSILGTRRSGTPGVQQIRSTLNSANYPNITVKAGIPVRWVINAPEGSITSCNERMFIPEYNIEYTFVPGENVIEFTPARRGEFQYACWMDMKRAVIRVE